MATYTITTNEMLTELEIAEVKRAKEFLLKLNEIDKNDELAVNAFKDSYKMDDLIQIHHVLMQIDKFNEINVDILASMAFMKEYKQAIDQIQIALELKYQVRTDIQMNVTFTGSRKPIQTGG